MNKTILFLVLLLVSSTDYAKSDRDSRNLTLDRIFASNEFSQKYLAPFQWIDEGNAYVRIEKDDSGHQELVCYQTNNSKRTILISEKQLRAEGSDNPLSIDGFSFSPNERKVLLFTNSSRVWRAKTKGDYWVYDLDSEKLVQIGKKFPASSLMFAKFSPDQSKVAYVHDFNLYVEDFVSGKITQLTTDGGKGIINGTFDWAYEEEFGDRDGFKWSPSGEQLAFWQLDASAMPTFYMINNTDSIYPKLIPLQYPTAGHDPSACKVGVIGLNSKKIEWVKLPGSTIQNYVPAMQWIDADRILIQQLNRHQNQLTIWCYSVSAKSLKKVYQENDKAWVDIQYPDVTASNWGNNDLELVDNGHAFLRLSEEDGWRHLYKIDIASGKSTLLTPGDYDVASLGAVGHNLVYFHASPDNSTQRYLYAVSLKGGGHLKRITPDSETGINAYKCAPNGKYAIYTHQSVLSGERVQIVSLPKHQVLNTLISNEEFNEKLKALNLPDVSFFKVTTKDGVSIDGRIIKPVDFNPSKKYPVLFHVYGEPWGAVATDNWVGLWNIFLAQKGYVIIDMDNRGTPCLKGAAWRKCIYRKMGVLNTRDQAQAAEAVLKKMPFLDSSRTAVWGWSGGGSMTQNLMFRYPKIYTTGMAVAGVAWQLTYDNIYQERYMGLPQENKEDFVEGSPLTYAKNLEGNLLLVHGTGDDNVHYQNMELLVNELVKYNKQFQMMSYPNRTHGIYEGANTTRHLYTLLTNYLMKNVPVNKNE